MRKPGGITQREELERKGFDGLGKLGYCSGVLEDLGVLVKLDVGCQGQSFERGGFGREVGDREGLERYLRCLSDRRVDLLPVRHGRRGKAEMAREVACSSPNCWEVWRLQIFSFGF